MKPRKTYVDRAIAAGWTPSNGFYGPREFLRLKPAERKAFRAANGRGRK